MEDLGKDFWSLKFTFQKFSLVFKVPPNFSLFVPISLKVFRNDGIFPKFFQWQVFPDRQKLFPKN